ncbi:MAG: YicC family protein [Syntrophobacterales bacterium CG_4_8_14_3_um_filter_58_8]|nr:MAG: YicC family protein [Syntrophaceae bacterium CG2_30_58_14]PIV02886.1 MAG: YicC family protein [Syntrophobacterales bacterium CG03_land_8_20_14_0_80_58_14]PJC74908.1 MAG: YicC family protein [Syntrophobacterales bacterium CG_4_8_14_3_um_filter_58_8]
MIKSMTGYGKAEAVLADRKFMIEMKSVNHRFLEISLRLPGMLLPLEGDIKKRIGEQFSRGRIEATLRMESDGGVETAGRFTLNLPLARNYHVLLGQLKEELHLGGEITLEMMAGFRDAFVPAEPSQDLAALWEGLSKLLAEAIRTLTEMREKEGESLKRDLTARLNLIAGFLEGIAGRAPQVVLDYQQRLTDRVRELTGGMAVDEARLLQEVAIMAEKSDITEEIVRFRSHIDQFTDLLAGADAAGRKIDFLIQEMGREINTIGSKSGDAEISRNVIEIKSELAKLREQVQNIE